ncbi:MAG TPA: outer membrane lipoprotein-sorting protein [Chitinispirillaceae bacterium]|nr:outer membrane lipoprotein-sorting protein [Chitinispirillaceae bacterium]
MIKRITLGISLMIAAIQATPPIDSILTNIDRRFTVVTDVKAKVNLAQQKEGQGVKKFEMMYYRRDTDQSFLIVMTGPEVEKGNGYLRVADNFWMYRKNTRTFQHINRDESIGGSDAHGDDFEGRKLREMYEPVKNEKGGELITEEMLGKIPVYKFEIKAKVNDVDYPKKVYWVQKSDYTTLKEASYSLSGTLMQTAYYLKFTEIKGSLIPVRQMFVDEFEKGNKTVLEISDISIDDLDDQIFTKAHLENLSK